MNYSLFCWYGFSNEQNQSAHTLQSRDLELTRLSAQVEELQREKIELSNDIIDKNTKLDELLGQEEQFEHLKNSLELEIYSKQQHINECEKVIASMHEERNG